MTILILTFLMLNVCNKLVVLTYNDKELGKKKNFKLSIHYSFRVQRHAMSLCIC